MKVVFLRGAFSCSLALCIASWFLSVGIAFFVPASEHPAVGPKQEVLLFVISGLLTLLVVWLSRMMRRQAGQLWDGRTCSSRFGCGL